MKYIGHDLGVITAARMNFFCRSMFVSFSSGVSINFFAASALSFGNRRSMS